MGDCGVGLCATFGYTLGRLSIIKNMDNPMSRLLRSLSAFCFVVLLPVAGAQATSIILYDDTDPVNPTPGVQDWLVAGSDSLVSGGTASEAAVTGGVRLVTDTAVSAGYSNYFPLVNTLKNSNFPVLDRSLGFSLSFELQVDSEAHSLSNDRAGFSVILLDKDNIGIELGFWEDEIWPQNPNFTHGQGVNFGTTASQVSYELLIQNNQYFLSADTVPILDGFLVEYTAPTVPYQLPNYLFLGDDTGSAGADITLGEVVLTTNPAAVPAPPVWGLLLLGLGLMARRRRLHRR